MLCFTFVHLLRCEQWTPSNSVLGVSLCTVSCAWCTKWAPMFGVAIPLVEEHEMLNFDCRHSMIVAWNCRSAHLVESVLRPLFKQVTQSDVFWCNDIRTLQGFSYNYMLITQKNCIFFRGTIALHADKYKYKKLKRRDTTRHQMIYTNHVVQGIVSHLNIAGCGLDANRMLGLLHDRHNLSFFTSFL